MAFDRRCADGCDRAAFGSMVVEVFPQLGPLDEEAVDAAFAECRRLARRAPEALVEVEAEPSTHVAGVLDPSRSRFFPRAPPLPNCVPVKRKERRLGVSAKFT